MFDLRAFFDQHGIKYRTSGANVSRGNIAIHCPFCGPDDPSEHLSVNIEGKGWRCWRHPDHRGKSPARLVRALLRCSMDKAREIVGHSVFLPEDFGDRVKALFASNDDAPEVDDLPLPDEFRRLGGQPSARPFVRYLTDRGFTPLQIGKMTNRYGIRYAIEGSYQGRIIFPVTYDGELVSWTGRSISKNATLRYKTLSTDEESADREGYRPALGAISHYLLWFDELEDTGGELLVLCEGPFDALKVDVLGRSQGIRATCFFTAAPTEAQVDLLHTLARRFDRVLLLLDKGTVSLGMRVSQQLASVRVDSAHLPKALKDPGEFTRDSFAKFFLAHR
jgi:hypothetical protein